jgi:hypothetical protein
VIVVVLGDDGGGNSEIVVRAGAGVRNVTVVGDVATFVVDFATLWGGVDPIAE